MICPFEINLLSRIILTTVVTALLAGCQTQQSMSLATLIERHTTARGGEQAIENVRSLRLALEITEPGFTVRGDYVATRKGYMRIDIYAGEERVFTEALGPGGGWQLLRGETVASNLSEGGDRALRRGLVGNLYGLHELQGLGYKMTLLGISTREGEEFWTIDQVAEDGFSKRLFIDKASFLIVRQMESSALHPDIDPTKTRQETLISNYKGSDGVQFSRLTEKFDFDKEEIVQTVVVRQVHVNSEIDMSIFERPG